jgi:hypothetical protein
MKKLLLILLPALAMIHCSKDDVPATIYTVSFDALGRAPVPAAQRVEEGNPVAAPAGNPANDNHATQVLKGGTLAEPSESPPASLDAYKTAPGWRDHAGKIVPDTD